MEKRTAALSLLFLTVIISGCVDNSGTGIEKTSGQAIQVTELDITPTEIREGSSVRVSMGVRNVGEVESEVQVGENGGKTLTNYCSDFFTINDFSSYSSSNPDTEETYDLAPDEEIQMDWELEQQGSVPLNGYSCDMKFQVPFNYSVEAFKQIQIKKNEDAGGEPQLSSKSSQGPLTIDMSVTGSSLDLSSPVFVEGDEPEVFIGFSNEEQEESKYQGLISLKEPNISANNIGFAEGECPEEEVGDNGEIQLYQGQSAQPIRCDLVYSRGDGDYTLGSIPSIRPEISVSADYTYTLNVGERTVEVLYSGN